MYVADKAPDDEEYDDYDDDYGNKQTHTHNTQVNM